MTCPANAERINKLKWMDGERRKYRVDVIDEVKKADTKAEEYWKNEMSLKLGSKIVFAENKMRIKTIEWVKEQLIKIMDSDEISTETFSERLLKILENTQSQENKPISESAIISGSSSNSGGEDIHKSPDTQAPQTDSVKESVLNTGENTHRKVKK